MTIEEVYGYLCSYDKRNPLFLEIWWDEPEEVLPRDNCACDNCFYGRDALAMEIIRLREALEFYANEDRWKDVETGIGMFPGDAIDYGETARLALSNSQK